MVYSWLGNVRELHNVADRFVLGLLEARFKLLKEAQAPTRTLSDQVSQFERVLIEGVLRRHRGNAAAASEALGMPKKTLTCAACPSVLERHEASICGRRVTPYGRRDRRRYFSGRVGDDLINVQREDDIVRPLWAGRDCAVGPTVTAYPRRH
jgi:hypothetical protein